MSRHVVIGTAGHVDHGKTALVRMLTGVDTDRWEEEKRRGITIDLGFAPLPLGDDLTASIVDVPGHEDFVRNMVAGATGVDLVMLVVAGDEGVMPQTLEHLAIMEFLDVRAGVPVVTKADLCEPDWLELVQADLQERLARSRITWEPPVVSSATTDRGRGDLLSALGHAAQRAAQRAVHDLFRLPIDRVFSVAGAGTVVTGSTWSGTVRVGDDVRILPGGHTGRIRNVEVHGTARDQAEPGRRTALALAGVDRALVTRGNVVVADPAWRATEAIDVMVTLLPTARPLTQRTRVRLHLGTAEILARVTPQGDRIAPGKTGPARLRLEQPVVARWGDRGILRSYSPVTTIGGCVVVDPWPPRRPRRPVQLEERAVPDPVSRVRAFIAAQPTQGIAGGELTVRIGLAPESVAAVVDRVAADGAARVGHVLVAETALQALERDVMETLTAYHEEQPEQPGMPLELVRQTVRPNALADGVLERLRRSKRVVTEGGVARLATHRARLEGADKQLAERLGTALQAAEYKGLSVDEAAATGAGDAALRLLEHSVRQGTAVKILGQRYYDRQAFDRLVREVVQEVGSRGRATPADLKDRTGLSRKYLIPVLEWLDQAGYTRREGDHRLLGAQGEHLIRAT